MPNESIHDVLIGGAWRPTRNPVSVFRAINPSTGDEIEGLYPVSDASDIEEALAAATAAVPGMVRTGPSAIADFLEAYAAAIEARAAELAAAAHRETGLPIEPRLRSVELPRAVFQLRQAAHTARDRSWCRATIDTKAGLRSKYGPLAGPVAVFGPNNFPFAYNSAAGTDFASALAAGNPVIAKAHPCHPATTRLFAETAFDCLAKGALPSAAFQLLYHMRPEDGLRLVSDRRLGASAFTGSRTGGLKLKEAADRAGRPIYLEMSSVNPVFLLPGALRERGDRIAEELFGSCTSGAGQFCTKPGLIVLIRDEAGEAFFETMKAAFEAAPAQVLLGKTVLDGIHAGLAAMTGAGAEIAAGGSAPAQPGFRFESTLLLVSGDAFLRSPRALQQEAFGPVSLAVLAEGAEQMKSIAAALDGNLTAAVFSHGGDDDERLYEDLAPILRAKCGRFLNDKVPTGVAVSPAMVHGGPYPATGHPGFTAVGFPVSLFRFAALHSYDHVRPHRLPPELQDRNPTGTMWRLIDGEMTQRDV
jgi:NADP-dependent aldehyde dehydrogenase